MQGRGLVSKMNLPVLDVLDEFDVPDQRSVDFDVPDCLPQRVFSSVSGPSASWEGRVHARHFTKQLQLATECSY